MGGSEEVGNWQTSLWALHQLGGANSFVDVEDVFLKCFELAPKRFAWRTRPDLPDYKKCAKALQEAEARRPLLLVKTADGYGRQLSVEGQTWVNANVQRLSALLASGRVVQEPKTRPRARLLTEIERSEVYSTWLVDGFIPTEKWRVAELLRCAPDSEPQLWTNRLQVLRSAAYAAGETQILAFLEKLLETHPGWFAGRTE
jgi:hypothetical protein